MIDILMVFGAFLVSLIFAFLFIIAGSALLSFSIPRSGTYPAPLRYGFGFFIGSALFLSLYRVLGALLTDARMSLFIATGVFIIAALALIFKFKRVDFLTTIRSLSSRQIFALLLAYLLIGAFILVYWLPPLFPTGHVEVSSNVLGSLHSAKYTNIATYALEHDKIPLVNQSYGQSLLASIDLFFGANLPFLALSIWLSFSLLALAIALCGLFQWFGLGGKAVWLGVFVILFGQTALSLTHIQVVDSGSPWFANGYSDSIAAFATFMVFLFLVYENAMTKFKSFWPMAALLAVLAISWNIVGAQNLVLALFALVIIFAFHYHKNRASAPTLAGLLAVFCIFAIAGAMMGGMLMPSFLNNAKDPVIGVYSVSDKANLSLNISLPYFYRGASSSWVAGSTATVNLPMQSNQSAADVLGKKNLTSGDSLAGHLSGWQLDLIMKSQETLFYYEEKLWEAIRISFFPILGLLLLKALLNWREKFGQWTIGKTDADKPVADRIGAIESFCNISILLLLLGFGIAFVIQIGNYKWELSRFLIIGYSLGMIALVLSVYVISRMLKSTLQKKILWAALLFFTAFGPLYNLAWTAAYHLFVKANSVGLPQRIYDLLTLSGMINKP